MKHRKLRIAWSVLWGIVAMLLIAMWVRSCWTTDAVYIPLWASAGVAFTSVSGSSGMAFSTTAPSGFHWQTNEIGILRQAVPLESLKYYTSIWGRFYIFNHASIGITVPHWFLIGALMAVASVPWFPWRFSLRTLLIATTLVAVGLGLIVWAAK